MKFLIDMPLSPSLSTRLRERGHDAIHASDCGLSEAFDTDILLYARQNGRTIVTADLDYPRLFALMEVDAPGLILFRGGNMSEETSRGLLDRLLDRFAEEELQRSLIVVDKKRIRKRELPIKK